MTSAGGYDIFLAKLSGADGHVLWTKRIGGTGADEGDALALDSSGNVFITGQFFGTVDFGGGSVTNTNPYAQTFLAKYSGLDGAHIWSKRLGKLVRYTPRPPWDRAAASPWIPRATSSSPATSAGPSTSAAGR